MSSTQPKSAQRQFLVKVAGIDGYFMQKTGGDVTSETTKAYDGGEVVPDILASPRNVDDVVVTRGFSRSRDGVLLKQLRQKVSSWRTTVSVTPTNEDLVADGEPTVYSDALLTGLQEIEVDAGSGDLATYQLTFGVGNVQ